MRHITAAMGLAIAYAFWSTPALPVVSLSLDKSLEIDSEIHDSIVSLLDTGLFRDGDATVDLSGVQAVAVSNGVLRFNPPVQVRWKWISSTITEVRTNQADGSIFVNIDNSPVNVRIRPK
jgi:hypothetical protein